MMVAEKGADLILEDARQVVELRSATQPAQSAAV